MLDLSPKPVADVFIIRGDYCASFLLSPNSVWKIGPPINLDKHEAFLKKYQKNSKVIFGPTIDDDRWVVLLKKEEQSIKEVIKSAIEKKRIAIPSHIQISKKELEVIEKQELVSRYKDEQDVMYFIYKNFKGKPNYFL